MRSTHCLFVISMISVLLACDGSGNAAPTSLWAEPASLNVNASPENSHYEIVQIKADRIPESGLYVNVQVEKPSESIIGVHLASGSKNSLLVYIEIAAARELGIGTFHNSLELSVCLDMLCKSPVRGSPLKIPIIINSDFQKIAVSAELNSIFVNGSQFDHTTPSSRTIPLTITGADSTDVSISIENESGNIYGIDYAGLNDTESGVDLHFNFVQPDLLSPGEIKALFRVNACLDDDCDGHIQGSPITIVVRYDVHRYSTGTNLVEPSARSTFDFKIEDAEFSNTLNAIFIASSEPDNAIYVHRLTENRTDKLLLGAKPTSISVVNGGDSNNIAVGHDRQVSLIEFNSKSPSKSRIKLLETKVNIFDIVATEEAAFIVSEKNYWSKLYRIDVIDNAISQSPVTSTYPRSKIRIHPDLESVYAVGSKPSSWDMRKFDITATSIPEPISSTHRSDYSICGNIWINKAGARLYTACGLIFKSSRNSIDDMSYIGNIPVKVDLLSNPNHIKDLADSPLTNEIAVIEQHRYAECQTDDFPTLQCLPHLSFFTERELIALDSFAFDITTSDGEMLFDNPKHLFYSPEGDKIYILSNLVGSSSAKSSLIELER